MHFSDLQAFVEIYDTGSVSRAAESLFITQPAASRRLQNLEASLGSALFDRVGKQLHLTDAGRVMLPRARQLLAGRDDAERAVADLAREVAGRLRLATSHHIGLHRLAPVLRRFVQSYPQVALDIRFEDSEAAHALVQDLSSDIAVVTLDPAGSGDLAYEPIWQDPLVFVAAPEHPLAGETNIALADIAEFPAILPGLATYTGRIVEGLFNTAGLTLTQSMSTNYLETIGMLVGTGLGWSVLPRTMVAADLVALAVAVPPMARQLGVVTNPRRQESRASRAFSGVLREFADPH